MPKAQTITVRARGLYDAGNNPWTLPDGALLTATNARIRRDNVIEPRPGLILPFAATPLHSLAFAFGGTTNNGSWLGYNGDTRTVHWWSVMNSVTALPGTYIATANGGLNLVGASSAKSYFFLTTLGTYAMDALTATPAAAGVTGALDLAAAVAGVGTAIPNNTQVAYRAVFGRRDANGRSILGAPSSRAVLRNIAGTVQDAQVIVTIPTEVQSASFFLQLYRTSASVDQNTDPGDECYLVYEAALSAVATVTIADSTPDGLGGASLYTNPSQETILGSNERPPLAYDLAEFGGAMWYADVTTPARQTINLLGVSGAGGLAINDTITVNGQVFTAKAAEVVAAREFLLATAGTADENVRATAASLIKCVNRTAAANATAIDLSEPYPAGIPGVISIRRTNFTSSLTLAVSRATAWANIVATTAPVRDKNGLMYSKTGQPDQIATAIYNAPVRVGTAIESVVRIVPTRSSLWIFKSDGIWRVTGTAGQFDVQVFDPTVSIRSALSAVALENSVYLLTESGVARVSDSGVEIVSRPIETTLAAVAGDYSTVAFADEFGHRYFLSSGTFAWYVLDTLTGTWTRYEYSVPAGWGAVDPQTGVVYFVTGTEVWRERSVRAGDSVLFTDGYTAVTLGALPTDVGGGSYTVPYTAGPAFSVGDLLTQSSGMATISGTLAGPTRLVLRDLVGNFFGAGAASISHHYQMTVAPFVKVSTPGVMAEWQEASILFGTVNGDTASVTLTGDSGSDPAIAIDKSLIQGSAKQARVWPGRTSSYSATMQLSYSEAVAHLTTPTTIHGVAWTLSPQGDGVSR